MQVNVMRKDDTVMVCDKDGFVMATFPGICNVVNKKQVLEAVQIFVSQWLHERLTGKEKVTKGTGVIHGKQSAEVQDKPKENPLILD